MLPALVRNSVVSVEEALSEGIEAAREVMAALENVPAGETHQSWSHQVQERAFGGISALSRLIALAVTDVAIEYVDGGDNLPESFAHRSEVLPATIELLESAISGAFSDARTLDELWTNLRDAGEALGFAVATSVAMSGELPLQLHSAEVVSRLEPRSKRLLICYGIGNATRDGCLHGRHLCSQLLASEKTERAVVVAVLKGLGGGLIGAGLEWLLSTGSRAVQDVESWSAAARSSAMVAFDVRHSLSFELAAFGLRYGPGIRRTTAHVRALLEAADAKEANAFRRWLRRNWWRLPYNLRGATYNVSVNASAADPCWRSERHPLVLALLLDSMEPDISADSSEWRWIRELLFHWDERVRQRVVELLSRSQRRPSAARPIAVSSNAEVIDLPPISLGRTALGRLQAAVWTADADVLVELAQNLKKSEKRRAMKLLLAAVQVPDMALRRAALQAMGQVGEAKDGGDILRVAMRFRTLEGYVVEALLEVGAIDQLDDLAELFNRRLKWADDQATDAFCSLADDAAIPHLINALNTRFFPPARSGAARAIAKGKHLPGVFALRKMAVGDTNDEARSTAARALKALNCKVPGSNELAGYMLSFCPIKELENAAEKAKLAKAYALPGLRQTLAKSSWMRRRAVCGVLATIPTKEAEKELLGALLDVDEDVRLAALEALFSRGWKPQNPREKTLAAIAARRMESLTLVERDRDLGTLTDALNLGGHVFRNEVLDLLERVPEWSVSDANISAIAGIRMSWRAMIEADDGVEIALQLLDLTWQSMPHRARLSRGLGHVEPSRLLSAVRQTQCGWRAVEAVCRLLARPNDDDAAEVLERFVLHQDDDVRRAAYESLATVGTRRAAEAVVVGLGTPFREDRRPAAQALAAIGQNALPTIAALVKSEWWECREAAAQAFAYWRGDLRVAADGLLSLAVDAEPRVSQTARDALVTHGVRPTTSGILRMLPRAQSSTIDGLGPWLGLFADGGVQEEKVLAGLEKLLEKSKADKLMFRIELVATLRARHLIPWLENVLTSDEKHLGVKFAAADALRQLGGKTCQLCTGRASVDCPGCSGKGEQTCPTCVGEAVLAVACPDEECNAGMAMRDISSAPCKTSRGIGQITMRCECVTGACTCQVCGGAARIRCPLCDGTGAPAPGLGS